VALDGEDAADLERLGLGGRVRDVGMIPVVLTLVMLTAPGGVHVAVNPEAVVSLRQRTFDSENPDIHCTISLTDGKTLAVIEDCATVFRQLTGK
jgi:hypothetical protein